ncbi:MAG: hypothetical protein IPF46_17670 [Saprospiraceae bacterium]|nr:hypothetical protein [Candidatus Vicinibacter affinis]
MGLIIILEKQPVFKLEATVYTFFGVNPQLGFLLVYPVFHRFSIVSSGTDSLVGIPMTKFGNKALRLNHPYGHNDDCTTDFDVNKIVKRFKVTQTNREFTIWLLLFLKILVSLIKIHNPISTFIVI